MQSILVIKDWFAHYTHTQYFHWLGSTLQTSAGIGRLVRGVMKYDS